MKAILACDDAWGIGKNGCLPWPKNTEDLKWFKSMTTGHTVVMGRGTWDSTGMPKPLPNRRNIVITNDPIEGVETYTAQTFTRTILPMLTNSQIWLIGGAKLFETMVSHISELHLSMISGTYNCDTFLSSELIEQHFFLDTTMHTDTMHIEVWKNKLHFPIV